MMKAMVSSLHILKQATNQTGINEVLKLIKFYCSITILKK